MVIILARTVGVCYGVERALDLAEEALGGASGDVYTHGPLIHNVQETERLEKAGIRQAEGIDAVPSGKVIIRAHGVPKAEYVKAEAKGLDIVDATCPFVKKPQGFVRRAALEGYYIVMVGKKGHPEVKGVASHARPGRFFLVDGEEDLEKLPDDEKRVAVVAQTTSTLSSLQRAVAACLERYEEVKVMNTICDDTAQRQSESRCLAREVDVMIVVGGYHSSNTKRLAELSAAIQPRTHHVEEAKELRPDWFAGVDRVGVTAGASTPKWVVEGVVEEIKTIGETRSEEEHTRNV